MRTLGKESDVCWVHIKAALLVSGEDSPNPGQQDQLQIVPAEAHTASFRTVLSLRLLTQALHSEHLSICRLLSEATGTQQHRVQGFKTLLPQSVSRKAEADDQHHFKASQDAPSSNAPA